MKAVMMSIRPKWCELIASGKKTVEVRKTRPKLETPFKCYIYETRGKIVRYSDIAWEFEGKGKVIGEFVCSNIAKGTSQFGSCLTMQEIAEYANNKEVYGWCISDLVIYEEPKELSEFYNSCGIPKNDIGVTKKCWKCDYYEVINGAVGCACYTEKPITRPPQSWCYVEELK
jgi:predicted transcriptional regulator